MSRSFGGNIIFLARGKPPSVETLSLEVDLNLKIGAIIPAITVDEGLSA